MLHKGFGSARSPLAARLICVVASVQRREDADCRSTCHLALPLHLGLGHLWIHSSIILQGPLQLQVRPPLLCYLYCLRHLQTGSGPCGNDSGSDPASCGRRPDSVRLRLLSLLPHFTCSTEEVEIANCYVHSCIKLPWGLQLQASPPFSRQHEL